MAWRNVVAANNASAPAGCVSQAREWQSQLLKHEEERTLSSVQVAQVEEELDGWWLRPASFKPQ